MADNFGLKIGLEGEKEFKKALSEINSSFKVLGSEMKLVESQFGKNDTSVNALTARNQVLNKEIEAQKQKIETLRSALENAASSFGENDKRTQAWQIQLNNAEAALNNMEREVSDNEKAIDSMSDEMGDAEKAVDGLGDEVEETGKQSDEAGGRFEKFGAVLKSVGKALAVTMAAIGTAAVAAGKKLYDMANDVAATGDNIDKMSQRLGLSREAYQEWDYVLSQSGVDINSVQTGKQFFVCYPTCAFFGSFSLSILRFVPLYKASIIADLYSARSDGTVRSSTSSSVSKDFLLSLFLRL